MLLLCAGALGACGGGGDSTPTAITPTVKTPQKLSKADFIKQADGYCAEVNAALGSVSGSSSTSASSGASQRAELYQGLMEHLRGLGTPDDQSGLDAFLSAGDAAPRPSAARCRRHRAATTRRWPAPRATPPARSRGSPAPPAPTASRSAARARAPTVRGSPRHALSAPSVAPTAPAPTATAPAPVPAAPAGGTAGTPAPTGGGSTGGGATGGGSSGGTSGSGGVGPG